MRVRLHAPVEVLHSSTDHAGYPHPTSLSDLSKLLHDAGYIVSLVPPESYLDVQTTEFSRFVNLTYPGELWPGETPATQFSYHGHNAYAVSRLYHSLTPALRRLA